MSGSLNQVQIIGNLGADPEVRSLGDGQEVVNLRIATSERWKDRATNEPKEKTEWHKVSIFGDGLVNVAKNYLKKGSKVFLQGKLETRKYEKDGVDHYSTEIVLRGFDAKLVMLDSRGENAGGGDYGSNGGGNAARQPAPADAGGDGLDMDIPF